MTTSATTRLGRNDPCHCGSGRKYKHCHLDQDMAAETARREAARPVAVADAYPGVACEEYRPITRKTPAVDRPDFMIAVRNLAGRGGVSWLRIAAPVDLGRDQASVDAAIAYMRERHVEPDFWQDPPPPVVAATQALLDRMLGRGVCRVEPSGVRLRRYGRIGAEPSSGGGPFIVYVSGRTHLRGVIEALIRAVGEDGRALGITDGLLAFAWPMIRVARELVVHQLSLPEPLAESGTELIAALIEVISDSGEHLGDPHGADAQRAMTALPFLIGLREARHQPRRELEGMGIEGPAIDVLAVHIEAAVEGPAWLLRLADMAGDDWDTPDGYRAWVEAARSVNEVAGLLDSLEPEDEAAVPEVAQTAWEIAPAVPPPEATVLPVAKAETPAALPATASPAPEGAFAHVDAVVEAHAARRAETHARLASILDRRETIARSRRELEDRIDALQGDDQLAAADQAGATDELDRLAEEEATARQEAVIDVLASGAEALWASAGTWSEKIDQRDGTDQASLAEAERIVREYEDAERRGLLKGLPAGIAARARADAEQARERLHQMLGGRDPIRVPVVVAASADPTLVIEVGLPFPGRDELEPGALHTALAVAIAGALTETVRSVEKETRLDEVEHKVAAPSISIVRLRFGAPPPVSAEECAQFCAMELSDLGRTSASLREAGISIEARVEPDLESED